MREAIERLQLTPVLFELGARPHPQRDLCRAYLQQSQIFVGIYWQRYGWVAPDETVSGFEDEYSLSAGMPRLLYVKAPAAEREHRLEQLVGRIQPTTPRPKTVPDAGGVGPPRQRRPRAAPQRAIHEPTRRHAHPTNH